MSYNDILTSLIIKILLLLNCSLFVLALQLYGEELMTDFLATLFSLVIVAHNMFILCITILTNIFYNVFNVITFNNGDIYHLVCGKQQVNVCVPRFKETLVSLLISFLLISRNFFQRVRQTRIKEFPCFCDQQPITEMQC